MDAATASIIAALISSVASIAVAVITTRARIGAPPLARDPSMPAAVPTEQPISVRRFRAVGWGLVVFLYFMAAVFIFFGALGYVVVSLGEAPPKDLQLATLFWGAGAIFAAIGYWAQRRLRRRRN